MHKEKDEHIQMSHLSNALFQSNLLHTYYRYISVKCPFMNSPFWGCSYQAKFLTTKLLTHTNEILVENIPLTNLIVTMNQNNPQVGGFEFAATFNRHIVPLADVVNVDGDTGIRT